MTEQNEPEQPPPEPPPEPPSKVPSWMTWMAGQEQASEGRLTRLMRTELRAVAQESENRIIKTVIAVIGAVAAVVTLYFTVFFTVVLGPRHNAPAAPAPIPVQLEIVSPVRFTVPPAADAQPPAAPAEPPAVAAAQKP